MSIQSQLLLHFVLQLILPLTLLIGSTLIWSKTRGISSIGMIAGSVLILLLAVATTACHPLFPLGRELSPQQYGVLAMRLTILRGIAWLVFGGGFLWMAITAKRENTEPHPGA